MLKLAVNSFEILFCNQAALNLYGANEANEIVGKSINDFISSESKLNTNEDSLRLIGDYKQRTLTQQDISTQIILNQLKEDKEAFIALVVDKTDELLFEQRKYDIIAQAEEREKKKIARELHDGLGQQLVLLNLLLQNIETLPEQKSALENIKQVLHNSIQEVKELAYNLLPPALEQGFLNALDRFAHRVNATGKLAFELEIDPSIDEDSFKNVDRFNLYRIVQESLNNALKHSQAKKVVISIAKNKDIISLIIKDDGVGFSPAKHESGLGIQNMKYRMRMANIHGEINSEEGKGVCINLTFGM